MAQVGTAEEFFTLYKHLKRPSTLPVVSDYHMFKKDIRPIWEDDENKKGGKWIVKLKKGVADRYWEELIFALIGDQFAEASEEVCGAVLSVRNGEDILSIWTRNDGGRVLKIRCVFRFTVRANRTNIIFRETMKRILTFPPETKLEFKRHEESLAQRAESDNARKEKSSQNHSSGNARNGSKDMDNSSLSDKKQSF